VQAPAAGSVFALPWRILVAPVPLWREQAGAAAWWPGLCWQVAAMLFGRLLSTHAMAELDAAVHIPGTQGSEAVVWTIVSLLLTGAGVVIANLALALAIRLLGQATGASLHFGRCLVISSLALIPFAFGDALGRAVLAAALPLSRDFAGAWAAHLRPFSFGLATFLSPAFPPLSFQWWFAAYFDSFGLWSVLLLGLGLRHSAHVAVHRLVWILVGLMLLFTLALAGLWQLGQQALLVPRNVVEEGLGCGARSAWWCL
jgi:hypothetical protein